MGPQAGNSIFLVLLVSFVVFAFKKPSNPGTENDSKHFSVIAYVGMIACTMILGLFILNNNGIIESDATLTFSMVLFTMEVLLNLLVPSLYISSTPNMKDYVKNCFLNGFYFITSQIAFTFVKIINSICQLMTLFQSSPRIYPTIE